MRGDGSCAPGTCDHATLPASPLDPRREAGGRRGAGHDPSSDSSSLSVHARHGRYHHDARGGTRSVGIDTLRIIGIAAVVVGHVWIDDTTRAVIYTWHVPLFFVLTGYFWTPGRPIGGELRKRWQTLGVPYLAWLVILLAMLAAAAAVKGGVGSDTFSGALYGARPPSGRSRRSGSSRCCS